MNPAEPQRKATQHHGSLERRGDLCADLGAHKPPPNRQPHSERNRDEAARPSALCAAVTYVGVKISAVVTDFISASVREPMEATLLSLALGRWKMVLTIFLGSAWLLGLG